MHTTNTQYNLPEIGKQVAYKAKRDGVEEHSPDPRVRKTLAVEVSRIDPYDQVLGEVALSLTRSAKAHAVQPFARLPSVPGSGQMLARGLVSEIQDLARFPRGQAFVSSCRLVKGATESNHNRLGTAGKNIGTVHLRWAFAEAAVLCLRHTQPGKEYFTKLAHTHGKAQALTGLAHQLGRAVYSMLTREHAFELQRFVSAYPLRGEREPTGSLADNG